MFFFINVLLRRTVKVDNTFRFSILPFSVGLVCFLLSLFQASAFGQDNEIIEGRRCDLSKASDLIFSVLLQPQSVRLSSSLNSVTSCSKGPIFQHLLDTASTQESSRNFNVQERMKSIYILGEIGACLSSESYMMICDLLMTSKSTDEDIDLAVSVLQKNLVDSSTLVQEVSVEALGKFGNYAAEATPDILRLLSATDINDRPEMAVRDRAAYSLLNISSINRFGLDYEASLIEILSQNDDDARIRAAQATSYLGSLLSHASSSYDLVLIPLNHVPPMPIEGESSVYVLDAGDSYRIRIFNDDGDVVLDTQDGEFSPDSDLLRSIEFAFRSATVSNRKELIQQIVLSLGQYPVGVLVQNLTDPNPAVRDSSAQALHQVGIRESTHIRSIIEFFLSDKYSDDIREESFNLLANLNVPFPMAIDPILEELLQSDHNHQPTATTLALLMAAENGLEMQSMSRDDLISILRLEGDYNYKTQLAALYFIEQSQVADAEIGSVIDTVIRNQSVDIEIAAVAVRAISSASIREGVDVRHQAISSLQYILDSIVCIDQNSCRLLTEGVRAIGQFLDTSDENLYYLLDLLNEPPDNSVSVLDRYIELRLVAARSIENILTQRRRAEISIGVQDALLRKHNELIYELTRDKDYLEFTNSEYRGLRRREDMNARLLVAKSLQSSISHIHSFGEDELISKEDSELIYWLGNRLSIAEDERPSGNETTGTLSRRKGFFCIIFGWACPNPSS